MISLCNSRIRGRFVAFPSLVSCQERNSINLSSAYSSFYLASTYLSIIDDEISHKGRMREILWHNKLKWLDNSLEIWRASNLNSPTWGYYLNLYIYSDSWAISSSFDLLNCSFIDCSLVNAWDSSCCFWIACWSILCFSLSNCSFNWSLDCLWAINYCSNCSILCCFSCTCLSRKIISWSFSLSKLLTSDALLYCFSGGRRWYISLRFSGLNEPNILPSAVQNVLSVVGIFSTTHLTTSVYGRILVHTAILWR